MHCMGHVHREHEALSHIPIELFLVQSTAFIYTLQKFCEHSGIRPLLGTASHLFIVEKCDYLRSNW